MKSNDPIIDIIERVDKLCQDLYKIERIEQQKEEERKVIFSYNNKVNKEDHQLNNSCPFIGIGTQVGLIDSLEAIINYLKRKDILPDFNVELYYFYLPREKKNNIHHRNSNNEEKIKNDLRL